MAAIMDSIRGTLAGRRAYKAHAEANRLLDAGKHEQARQSFDRALALYDEAYRLGCSHPGILMAYSLILMRYGRTEEAREIMLGLQGRADLSPADKKQLRINYAVCQWKLGDLDRAIALMKEAGSSGMTGAIYNTLGLFLIQKAERTGDFAEATAFCAKALDYDDEDADTLDNLGELHLARSRQAAAAGEGETAVSERAVAADYFDKALAIKPKLITSLYYRAQMLHEDGDDARARELLQRTQSVSIGMLCPVTRAQIDDLLRETGA